MTTPGRRGTVGHTQCPYKIQEDQTMEDVIKVIADNGISVVCVGYLIYFQSVTMRDMLTALNSITERLAKIEEKIDDRKE